MVINHQPKAISIMLAEDNEDHADITIDSLRENNVSNHITHVENGKEAIDFLINATDSELPDLVLLDIKMPIKSGFDVLEFIRNNSRIRHIPAIMISTTQNEQEIKKAYELGANSFIVKPVEFDSFTSVIRELNLYWTVTAILPNSGDNP